MHRLALQSIAVLLLICLSGVAVAAANLPLQSVAGGCADACCPGSTDQDEPTGKCPPLQCQCPSCLNVYLHYFCLSLKSLGETGAVPLEASRRPPGEHPRLIDYPPETT